MLESASAFAAESEALDVDVPHTTQDWGDGMVARLIEKVLAPEFPSPFVLSARQDTANLELLRLGTGAYLEKVEADHAASCQVR